MCDSHSASPVISQGKTLVLVELNHLLVCRHKGEALAGAALDGLDGSVRRRPFYIRPGAAELLKSLWCDDRCEAAIMTAMGPGTIGPIVNLLQRRAGLSQDLLVFDSRSAKLHENPAEAFEDGTRKTQHDTLNLLKQCVDKHGFNIDTRRVVAVISKEDSIRKDQLQHALKLAPFGLDDVLDGSGASMDLHEARGILESILQATSTSSFYEILEKAAKRQIRETRSIDDQPKVLLRLAPSITILEPWR